MNNRYLLIFLLLNTSLIHIAQAETIFLPQTEPALGMTGWQTYTLNFSEAWSGEFVIGISDYDDNIRFLATLAVDNIQLNGVTGPVETGFESPYQIDDMGKRNYPDTGYYYVGKSFCCASNFEDPILRPTEGAAMGLIFSWGNNFPDLREPTTDFGGSVGSYLTYEIDAVAGGSLSIDWNYFAPTHVPYETFAFAALKQNGDTTYNTEILATVAPVPLPASIWLFGSAMAGLLGFVSRKTKVSTLPKLNSC